VRSRLNMLISGGTGAGKTTLLNVLSSFIPDRERIVTIEDAAELRLNQDHVLRLESRPKDLSGENEIPIRMLVRNSLRMRPDRIIVGEVRGEEALDMLQAMNTGHDGSLTTVHANTPRDALSRLETMIAMANVNLPDKAMRPKGAQRFKWSNAGKDIRDGISFLRGHPLARAMTAGIVVAFAGVGSVIAIGPIFAKETVHAGAPGWGFLVTALGIGMGIGMALVPQISKFVERELMFPATMLGAAIVLGVVAAMPNISLAAVFTVLMGIFAGATWVNGYQVTDWTDDRKESDNARNGFKKGKGALSIQGHDPTTDLSFRNIRIQSLDK